MKRCMTAAQHEELAARIAQAEQALSFCHEEIARAYGVSDRATKILDRLVLTAGQLGRLRIRLADHYYAERHAEPSPYFRRG